MDGVGEMQLHPCRVAVPSRFGAVVLSRTQVVLSRAPLTCITRQTPLGNTPTTCGGCKGKHRRETVTQPRSVCHCFLPKGPPSRQNLIFQQNRVFLLAVKEITSHHTKRFGLGGR